jgi:hypothetical protein
MIGCETEDSPETGNAITGIALSRVIAAVDADGADTVDLVPIEVLGCEIDAEKATLTATISSDWDRSKLHPDISGSAGASVKYKDAAIQPNDPFNFSTPQSFTVTAEDGTARTWSVAVKQIVTGSSDTQNLSVELLGANTIRFFFSYPGNQKAGANGAYAADEDNPYGGATYLAEKPILLSYFVNDNELWTVPEATEEGEDPVKKTYYNTLVVSAAGFSDITWKVDGYTVPGHDVEGSYTANSANNILTIHAQDWTEENLHIVYFEGTKKDEDGGYIGKFSGTFTFKVVERTVKEAY